VDLLVGDATKAKTELGWEPEYTFAGMIKEMVEADLRIAASQGSGAQAAAKL
jgi:GDPmannose 4,6-dehydratase